MHATRRTLLRAAPALAIGVAVPVSAANHQPDVELIEACAEYRRTEEQERAVYDGPNAVWDDDEARVVAAPYSARCDVLLDRLGELRAATPAGIHARAQTLAQHNGAFVFSFDGGGAAGRMLAYLLRDAAELGMTPTSSAPAVRDAELITACEQHDMLERQSLATFDAIADEMERDAAQAPIKAAQEPLLDSICDLPATTPEGHRARARSLALWDLDLMRRGAGSCPNDRMVAAMVRDLIGGAA